MLCLVCACARADVVCLCVVFCACAMCVLGVQSCVRIAAVCAVWLRLRAAPACTVHGSSLGGAASANERRGLVGDARVYGT